MCHRSEGGGGSCCGAAVATAYRRPAWDGTGTGSVELRSAGRGQGAGELRWEARDGTHLRFAVDAELDATPALHRGTCERDRRRGCPLLDRAEAHRRCC
jgi:hypothetical protein